MPKYMRIQGWEIAFKTGKPAGLFALCWRRIRDGIFSAEDEAAFRAEVTPITWFKIDCPEEMKNRTAVITGLLDKYIVGKNQRKETFLSNFLYNKVFFKKWCYTYKT